MWSTLSVTNFFPTLFQSLTIRTWMQGHSYSPPLGFKKSLLHFYTSHFLSAHIDLFLFPSLLPFFFLPFTNINTFEERNVFRTTYHHYNKLHSTSNLFNLSFFYSIFDTKSNLPILKREVGTEDFYSIKWGTTLWIFYLWINFIRLCRGFPWVESWSFFSFFLSTSYFLFF